MSPAAVDERLIRNAASGIEGLLELLVEGLGWPLPDDLETIPLLSWEPEELGLNRDQLGRLTSIKQVPRLTARQPFGVFVLTFDGGRLPIGALRRLVGQLVRRQRRRIPASNNLWDLGDLVFFCHNDNGQGSVHVVAFHETSGRQEIRTLSWTSQPTPTRLRLLSQHALPDLFWPEANIQIDQWRSQWRDAFAAGYRQGVTTAAQLSQRMAEVATDIRNEITDLLAVETEDGLLHTLLADMRERLDATIDNEKFGDMFAQTLVYGLLSSRISHPEAFQAAEGQALLDFENPFLDAIYDTFRTGAEDALDLDHLGLSDLAHTLAVTDIDALLADFGASERRDDPVIYLYEEFLDRYDPAQRRSLGAYYTPIPIVTAMISLVDHALVTTADLPRGIADTTTWGQWAERHPGTDLPEGVAATDPVVHVIDPATGTGTFLLQWIRRIKQDPNLDLAEHLHRLSAIEISMASYAVAHLKIGLELPTNLRRQVRLPLYLADTLSGPRPQHLTGLEDPIARETELAQQVKLEDHHSVVIGNPPYLRLPRGDGGGWILHPGPGQPHLFDGVLKPAVQHTIFSYTASLYNLYVYFWRWALWKAFEHTPNGPGVVAFITASSWLDGPGFLGLRQLARQVADEIWVIDLGGNNRGGSQDENVFGIETPVAIVVLARANRWNPDIPATVRHLKIEGSAIAKLAQLEHLDPATATWQTLDGSWFDNMKPGTGGETWTDHPLLVDLIPWQQPGCMYNRTWPIAPHPDLLRQRWERFLSTADPDDRAACFVTPPTGRNIHTRVAGYPRLADEPIGALPPSTAAYGYRSFDEQYTFDDPRIAALDRPTLWASLSDRQIFMVTTTTQPLTSGPGATVFIGVPDKHAYNGRGGKDVLPLYRDASLTPNADPALLVAIGTEHKSIDPTSREPTAEDLFTYCFGVMAGTDYTARFAEGLATRGPRIPLSADPELFARMAKHGRTLIAIQTAGHRYPDDQPSSPKAAVQWTRQPTRVLANARDFHYEPETRNLSVADGLLAGVPPEVWEFDVSGMFVVRKWLGYRTASGAGRAASSHSPLDQIRSDRWYSEWSAELVSLVCKLESTISAMAIGAELLSAILEGPVVAGAALPQPPAGLREPPTAPRRGPGSPDELF